MTKPNLDHFLRLVEQAETITIVLPVQPAQALMHTESEEQ